MLDVGSSCCRACTDRLGWAPWWQQRGCLKRTEAEADTGRKVREHTDNESVPRSRQQLVCRLCRSEITSRDEAIQVENAHRHTFFNPAGVLFEIGCFSRAPGCHTVGQASTYFAWFAGYSWRITLCGCCHTHLGWFFEHGEGQSFFGLVADRLIEEEV